MTDILPSTVRARRIQRKVALPTGSRAQTELRMQTEWLDFDVALASVFGDIDSTNVGEVLDFALGKALLSRRLVLDLSRVQFCSCEGYSMLKTLERRCGLADVELKVIPSASVARMKRICEFADQRAS
jgi:anti-anti-sigma regulatory factor